MRETLGSISKKLKNEHGLRGSDARTSSIGLESAFYKVYNEERVSGSFWIMVLTTKDRLWIIQ